MPELTLGERLRARRIALDLTLAAVAEESGLSLPYVSNLERGRGNPTVEALTSLARALKVSLAELIGERSAESGNLDLLQAQIPSSLLSFSRSERFRSVAQRLADAQGCTTEEMRQRLLVGMISSPRRSQGESAEEDWRRLLDTYTLILGKE